MAGLHHMTQRIAIITTGGTIGSAAKDGTMAVDPTGDGIHRELTALQTRLDCHFHIYPAFNINSEDLTPSDWATLFAAVDKAAEDGFDRIVITHGTDTLVYSAAALALVYRGAGLRICLTGSFIALGEDNSDGPLNLLAALQGVRADTLESGVYVAFRRDGTNTSAQIYDALDVRAMGADDLAFASRQGRCVAQVSSDGDMKRGGLLPARTVPSLAESESRWTPDSLRVAARQMLFLRCYPGLALDRIDHTRLSLLVLELYHSGTARAQKGQGSLRSLMDGKQLSAPVIAATFPSELVPVPYESTATLLQAGVHVVKDLPPHVVYVYALLQLASGLSGEAIVAALKPWLLPGGA